LKFAQTPRLNRKAASKNGWDARPAIDRDIEKLTEHWHAESGPFATDCGLRSLSRSGT